MIGELKPYAQYADAGLAWLEKVPAHWRVLRNGNLFGQRNETDRAELPILEVSLKTGVRVRTFGDGGRKQVMSDLGKYKRAAQGDLAYNTMRMWQGALGVCPVDGLVSPAYVVARPFPDVEPRYFAALFRTAVYMAEIDSASRGIVKDRNRLYWEQFKQMRSLCPPPEEQSAIVRFLDWANGRLERTIRAKRKVIALLNEQKQAVIHRAVTRGLDPLVATKPSGIPWLGKIPQHWEVRRLKSLVKDSVAGPYGSSLTKAMYTGSGYRVYGQQQVIPDNFTVGDYYVSKEKFADMQRYRVFPGDVLVSVMGTVGRVAVVPDGADAGIINPRLVRYRPNTAMVRPRWLQSSMQAATAQAQLLEGAKGTTMDGLNMRILGQLSLLVPPLSEQDAILDFLAIERLPIESAIARLESEIDLLRDYRTRLIADVVTGQLDVREAAAHLPAETTEELTTTEADAEEDVPDEEALAE